MPSLVDKKKITKWSLAIITLFYAVGIISHAIKPLLPIMLILTPWVLAVAGLFVFVLSLFLSSGYRRKRIVLWAVGAYIVTFSLEALGVATGAVFGTYWYGRTLGISFLEVPVVIGFNWVLIIAALSGYAAQAIDKKFTMLAPFIKTIFTALFCGMMAVIFDFIMEPVAIKLDYWQWQNSTIPLQNYAAWFVIALVFGFIYHNLKIEKQKESYPVILMGGYFLIQALFFILLRVEMAAGLL